MAPAAVAIFLISLFVGVYSAPKRCASCQTWESQSGYQAQSGSSGGWINQDNLSQRSANLEDLTQQAETELNRSPGQLAFSNARPGNWTDVNHYSTADGSGKVYEEQGQRVAGPTRIRFYRKNFTSSYASGNPGGFRETDLGGFNSLGSGGGSQLLNHGTYDQTQSSTYDQSVTGGNSYIERGAEHFIGGVSSPSNAYYKKRNNTGRDNGSDSAFSGQSTQQGSTAWNQGTAVNYDRTQGSAYDRSFTGGNSYIERGAEHFIGGANSPSNAYYKKRNNTGRDNGSDSAFNVQSTQQGSTAWDQGRAGNWTTANSYRTDGGNGQVHEERGQYITGPSQVRFYKKNYTSSYTSGGAIPTSGLGVDGSRSFESEVEQLQRQFASVGRDAHPTSLNSLNGGYTQQTTTHYVQPSSTVGQTNYGYVVRPANYQPQSQTTSGTNTHGTYQHSSNFESQHGSQTSGTTVSDIQEEWKRNQNSGYSTGSYGNNNGYGNQQIQRISAVEQPGRTGPAYSGSQTLQSYYDHLSQSEQAEYRRIYGLTGLSHTGIPVSNVNDQQQSYGTGSYGTTIPSGQIQHYEQFQTSSSGSSYRPDFDVRYTGAGSNQETQQIYNAHNSLGQTASNNYGSTYPAHNGQLVTHGIDLGQVGQAADCASGTSGHSSYEQSHYHRVYRGAGQPEDLTQQVEDLTQQTEDLTQQTQDLTQQTEDLTQQTQDLTQQTEDLTQQTEDLTQQSQDFGQHTSWNSGKLELGSQQVHDLTQRTEDLTQQAQDLTQQTQDLTQQTEDLTQQTEDLTQQSQHFGDQSPWGSGKLEVESQRVHDLTQQTEDLTQQTQDFTQQTQDLTQQTEDLTQQTEDLTQQTQHFGDQSPWRPGKLEVESQRVHDLTQQTEDLTQQTQDFTQQTQDLTQQTEDLTQQTEDLTQQTQHFGDQSPWRPGKLEVESQRVHDLTQQTEDLTQQTQDFTQQTQDLTQQTEDLTQQTEDLTQQTEDLTQQTEDLVQRDQGFGQQSFWRPGQLEVGNQQVEDLTHEIGQTDDYYLQKPAEDRDFGQGYWKPGKLEAGSQQAEDFTQQTEDLTQQTEDLTQQTEDLTQQTEDLTQQTEDLTQHVGQESSWKPGKLEVESQQVEGLTQQIEDLTQQTEDLTQQTEDLTQQTEDLTQQTEDEAQSKWEIGEPDYVPYVESSRDINYKFVRPDNSDITSQQAEDLTQQTEDLTQQTEDLTQQTEDLTQQTEDLTQQTEDLTQHVGQESSWEPGKLEVESQQVEDLTQQTEDLTQQTEDLTQQTEDLTQQTEDLTQQTEDLTQQTEDLTQHVGQETSWEPGKLEVGSQQIDLTQQTEDLTQQTEDLTQQTEDLTQQTEDLAQQIGQTDDWWLKPSGAHDFGQESSWKPGKLEVESQQVEDLTQQTEDLTQQTEDLTQQTEDLTQQTEDLTQHVGQESSWRPGKLEVGNQQVEDLTQQTEDLTQQTEDLTQQTEDLTQQIGQTDDWWLKPSGAHDFGQESSWKPGKLEVESQQVEDLTQQTEDLTQQTEDLTQQTEDLTQQTEDLGQQTEDLTQQIAGSDDYLHQSSWRPGQLVIGDQQVEDLTQQTGDLGQQTENLGQQLENFGQQTEELGQQTQDLSQQTGNTDYYTDQITGNSGFGQESSWNSPDQGIINQQTQNLHQEIQTGTQQTPVYVGPGTIITPKPAPKPKRPRPSNFHHTQQINVELEEPTTDSHTTLHNDQQNNQKWESRDHSTRVPIVPPHRGDQGIDPNSNEPEPRDLQIESATHKVPEQQSGYVSTYPGSFNQQTTTEEQFRPVQPTKTKTGRRKYQGVKPRPWEGPQDWNPPRDVVYSQQPTIRYVESRPVTENIPRHWANTEGAQPVDSSQTFQRIQHVGASIEDRHQSGQSEEVVRIQPRILEAYGANGPYDTDHKLDIFDSAKPNPGAALVPPGGEDAWDIRVIDRRITTTTEVPTPPEITTTTTTTTPTPPTTPAPSFWRRVGSSFTNTYDKAKEKAKELFG